MNISPYTFYIISNINLAEKSAATTRMLYYAKALADNVNQVYLVTSCSTKLSDSRFIEVDPNVFVMEKKNITFSFWGTFFFLKRLNNFSKGKEGKKSFILYPTAFFVTELWTIIYLKFYKKYPVFYELNEVRKYASSYEAPLSFNRLLYSLKKIIFKILFTITQPLLRFYDGLICISTEIENYGKRFNKNTIRIPILTDPDINLDSNVEVLENKYFKEATFNIGFSGSIHPIKEDLENFIAVIEKLKTNGYSVSFNLCGAVFKTYKEYFIQLCQIREELTFYGFLNELELSTFLSQQDLLVIPRGYTLQNNYGFSTKLSDYLNHKKVILVTEISDNGMYIKDGVNGFITPPNDKDAMYEKLTYIIDNHEAIKIDVVSNALETSKRYFDYRIYTKKLQNFLKKEKLAYIAH